MTNEELQKQIDELKREIQFLKSSTTIPLDTENAFRVRFGLANYAILAGSTKSAASENQAVNEAGVATYSVLKPPDGFRQFIVGGVALYFPYYL